jgi:AAA domain
MHEQLKEALLKVGRSGKRLVLIIDEAQGLEDGALELIRLLSNFETSQSKLMQIVLAGQPTLASRLGHCTLDPLRQRVSIISRLEPFGPAETSCYVDHRLRVAGHVGQSMFNQPLFNQDALELLAKESHGIPRIINNLCFNALSLGYAEGQKIINGSIIKRVAADLELNREAESYAEEAPSHELPSHIETPESHADLPVSISSPDFPRDTGFVPPPPPAACPVRVDVPEPSLSQPARHWRERLSSRASLWPAALPVWALRLVILGVLSLGAGFFMSALLDRRSFPKPLATEAASRRTVTEMRPQTPSQEPTLQSQFDRFCDKVSHGVQELDKKLQHLVKPGGGG